MVMGLTMYRVRKNRKNRKKLDINIAKTAENDGYTDDFICFHMGDRTIAGSGGFHVLAVSKRDGSRNADT